MRYNGQVHVKQKAATMQTTPVTCVCVFWCVCVSSFPSLLSLSLFPPLCHATSCCSATNSLHFAFAFVFLLCAVLNEALPAFRLRRVKEFTVDCWLVNSGAFIAVARLLLLPSRFTCCQLICINYFLTSKREREWEWGGEGEGRWAVYIYRVPMQIQWERQWDRPAIRTANDNDSWLTNNWTELWTPTTITTTRIIITSVQAKWKQQLQLSNRYLIC